MSWKTDEEYKRRLASTRTADLREESLRQVRTNVAQILDAFGEVSPKLRGKTVDKNFLPDFEEWFWDRNQKARSADTEKMLAFMNRLRRYLKIAVQLGATPGQIQDDYRELFTFFETLLELYQNPEEAVGEDELSYLDHVEVLEKLLFPRVGMEPGQGPDSCLVYLSKLPEIYSCLRVLLTPTIPPTIPKKIDRKLFGISEKTTNIFNGITLNFVTDVRYFDVTANLPTGEEQWKLPGISYHKVMEPFLSDFGVNEKTFFKTLCSHIGLQVAKSEKEDEMFFILDPSFVKVFHKIGYLQRRELEDGAVLWYPQISEETLFLQYLALVATNRAAVQPDFAFWISLTFAYYLYRLVSEKFLRPGNVFRGFVVDDLVRVSIIPYSAKSVALELGGIDWARKMPTELEPRKDVLSGLLKISTCDHARMLAKFEEKVEDLFEEAEEEEVEADELLSDPRFWDRGSG